MRRSILLLLVLASAGFAYIRQTTGTTPLVRTDNGGIQFYLNNLVVAGVQSSASGSTGTVIAGDSNPQAAIHAALATWTASGASVNFLALKSTAAAINGSDNQMTIAIGSTSSDVSVVGGALAVTLDTFNPSTGVIMDSDIIINPADCFSTTGAASPCAPRTAYDFQATMTHELGHSLGLNHTGLLGSTMFQYNTPTERALSSDELAFVDNVYLSPYTFGTISGTVTTGGAPEPYALITMASTTIPDPAQGQTVGASYSALADANGAYSQKVPPGSYQVYAEPLNGVVEPGNLYFTSLQAAQVQQFMATRFSGAVAVTANSTSSASISVAGGASALPVPYIGATSVGGGIGGVEFYTGGPTFVASGQSVDLVIGGTGFDGTLTAANFAVLGGGVTVSNVQVDNGSTVGGFKVLRVTLNITAQQGLSLASLFVTKGGNTLSISGALVIGPPTPATSTAGVVNAASEANNGVVAPGGLATLYASPYLPGQPNLGSATPYFSAPNYDAYGLIAATLDGVTVTFDGVPAPLFFLNGTQINLQVPYEVAGKASTTVIVNYLGSVSAPVIVQVAPVQPAMITVDSSGTGPVAAVNQDNTLNSAANPAPKGTVVTIYGTGVGQPSGYPVLVTGAGAAGPPGGFTGNYTYSIGGSTPAAAAYAGPTPTSAGLAQFNLAIPQSSASGPVSVVVTSPTGVSSRTGTTIFVK